MAKGTFTIDDLKAVNDQSVASFGEDTVAEVLNADLANYNAQLIEQLSLFCQPTTAQNMVYGTNAMIDQIESDELGEAVTEKNVTGVTVGMPLRLYKSAVGWNSKYMEIATPSELAEKYIQIRTGHAYRVSQNLKKAIFNNVNYDFVDKLFNGVTLNVKRFINADSSVMPKSPAGASFDSTSHTHYLAKAASSLANDDITKLVDHISEHGHTDGLMIVIALANKAAISALTDFTPLTSVRVRDNGGIETADRLTGGENIENMLIGYWQDLYPVYVKPWAVSNYVVALSAGAAEKPLAFRQRPQPSLQGLRMVAAIKDYPLMVENFESEYGFGCWNRTAGGVLYIGGTSWVNPTIA